MTDLLERVMTAARSIQIDVRESIGFKSSSGHPHLGEGMIKQLMVAGALAAALTPAVAGNREPSYYTRVIAIETKQMNRAKCMPDFHRLCAGQQARNNAMARCLGHLQASLSVACGPVVTDWCNEGLC